MIRMKWLRQTLVLLATHMLATAAFGQSAADRLLALVPEDAGMTALVENLRDRRVPFLQSPIAAQMARSPELRAWWNTHGKRPWHSVDESVRAATGLPLAKAIDVLFGDAVVLSIHLPENGGPESAQGLFLLAPRDPALLKRLVDQINAREKTSGPLREVVPKKSEHGAYFVRRFQPGTKADEAYAILDDAILAWSNSEALIRRVLAQHVSGRGLSSNSRFKTVRESLPNEALVSLFIDPRFVERLAAKSATDGKRTETETHLAGLFERYLSAMRYAGASLVWRDGPAIETYETIDPEKLGRTLRRWTERTEGRGDWLARVPSSALWVVSARVDFVALLDLTLETVPDAQRQRVRRMLDAARGLLLGRDPREEIFPALGPGVIAYADAPRNAKPGEKPALVIGVALDASKDVRPALENALRTLLDLISLDDKKTAEESRISVVERAGQSVVALGTAPKAVAYVVTDEWLALGNDPDRVADFVVGQTEHSEQPSLLDAIPERITRSGGFGVVNLDRVIPQVSAHREEAAGELNLSVQDLDGLLAAGRLFRVAYFTTSVSKDSASVRRSVGMIGKLSGR